MGPDCSQIENDLNAKQQEVDINAINLADVGGPTNPL
jgi:hypothetical protein